MKKLLVVFIFFTFQGLAQKLKKADNIILKNLRTHIGYLADDKLEGRSTGSAGEKLAYNYIENQFRNAGLQPKGDSGTYLQHFTFDDGIEIDKSTYFSVNGTNLTVNEDFFPLSFSAGKFVEASPVMAFQEKGMPWFYDIKQLLAENENNPHFDLSSYLQEKSRQVGKRGSTALIVFNSSSMEDGLSFDHSSKESTAEIPVVYINKAAKVKYFKDTSSAIDIKMQIDIRKKNRTGTNVIAWVNNGAANTVIVGAHFDHLGYGEDHNSLWTGPAQIHNGADDNASGTAGVIELGRMLGKHALKNNNYLFICFSGEELGLYGSKYFTNHPTVNLDAVDYMINLDMIGRFNDTTKKLLIGGYGTSPSWGKILTANTKPFHVKFDSSGVGPSDHTSFYRKDIPVLFFFTGLHSDYHKPSDDVEKINFTGEVYVLKYIYKILEQTNQPQKIAFTKTKEMQLGASPSFTVTLGIMPDYAFSGRGIRADGIVEGKVAEQAGILQGDVIISFDDYKTPDLTTYMKALGQYKKGDPAKVKVLRGNEEILFNIVF